MCNRRVGEKGDVAALDGRSAETVSHAAIDAEGVRDVVHARQFPRHMIVGDSAVLGSVGGDDQVFFVVGVTHASGGGELVGHIIAGLTVDRIRCVGVFQRRRERKAGGANCGDGECAVKVIGAGLPEKATVRIGRQTQLLGGLVQIIDGVPRVAVKRNEAGTNAGDAAVDIAFGGSGQGFVACNRGQGDRAEVIDQTGVRAPAFIGLMIVCAFVVGHRFAIVIGVQLVGASVQNVGAKDGCGAVQVTAMHIDQRFKAIVRCEQHLHATRQFVEFAKVVAAGDFGVVDIVVTVLGQDRHTGFQNVADQRARHCGLKVARAQ